ncbi:MAG: hypothetical protein QUV05_07385 [Phycisphaerae bacterium]|nr:hypothetical protein [Phycisphaerae bacterium]
MTDEVFAAHIEEARHKIESLPENQRGPLLRFLDETSRRQANLRVSFAHLRRLLDDWRLQVKYMAFDLEATRRELAELRRRQEDSDPQA